jgi:NAD(P)-dependent dehydrogenase (short-subunit alcohol dehydrogenase family)
MLLEKKNAIVHGGGGGVGGGVARTFAREGASVFLAGRTQAPMRRWPPTSGPPAGRPRWPSSTPPTSGRWSAR